jgi:hypothetical protein
VTEPAPRKKKRVRPARKIVPRGRMGASWVVGSLALGGLILVAGIVFLIAQTR